MLLTFDYCPPDSTLQYGTWLLGKPHINGVMPFPRQSVCGNCRRLVSAAKKIDGVRLIIPEIVWQIVKLENWKWEGWENPEVMISWMDSVAAYG